MTHGALVATFSLIELRVLLRGVEYTDEAWFALPTLIHVKVVSFSTVLSAKAADRWASRAFRTDLLRTTWLRLVSASRAIGTFGALLRFLAATACSLAVEARWALQRVSRAARANIASGARVLIAIAGAGRAEVTAWAEATVLDIVSDVCGTDEDLFEGNSLSRTCQFIDVGTADAADRVIINSTGAEMSRRALVLVT